jgi:hypothetical protein
MAATRKPWTKEQLQRSLELSFEKGDKPYFADGSWHFKSYSDPTKSYAIPYENPTCECMGFKTGFGHCRHIARASWEHHNTVRVLRGQPMLKPPAGYNYDGSKVEQKELVTA